MCGIAGYFGMDDKKLLRSMTEILSHRGPDGDGYYTDANVGLGHRRLSIIDIAGGKQPLYSEDKNIVAVVNGEIYNYKELRASLEQLGHKFATNSDSEVVVHGYEEYGLDIAARLEGMFAFAVYDSIKKRLVLARDIAGIKPVYYTMAGNVFLFSSEMKSLLLYDQVKRDVDKKTMYDYFMYGNSPTYHTMIKGIYRLSPAHILVCDDDSLTVEKYFTLPEMKNNDINIHDTLKVFDGLMENAVEKRLMSEVPLGMWLSGGIDSSTIAYYMCKLKNPDDVKTYSFGFGEPNDENAIAKALSEHLGTDHHEFIFDSETLPLEPTAIWHLDEPFKSTTQMFTMSKEIKHEVTVSLLGYGADEIFGGYTPRQYFIRLAQRINPILPSFTSPIFSRISDKFHENSRFRLGFDILAESVKDEIDKNKIYHMLHAHAPTFSQSDINHLFPAQEKGYEPYKNSFGYGRFLDEALRAEFNTYLSEDLLLIVDKSTMAHSVEARVPFLDRGLIDFAFSLPPYLKVRNFSRGKYILYKLMQGKLPKYITTRKKQGMAMNPYYWHKALKEYSGPLLDEKSMKERGLDYGFVKKLIDTPYDMNYKWDMNRLWLLMCLEIWFKTFIDRDDIRKPLPNLGM